VKRVALLLLAVSLYAQPERFDLLVRDDFFAGMFGDRVRLDKGMKYCEEILRKNPKHAQALVWHGSGLMTQSATAYAEGKTPLGDKMWKQGLYELNRGRALAPDDLGVKIGRSALLIGIAQSGYDPEDREGRELLESAVRDYEVVFAKQKEYFSKLSDHSRCELLFGLAAGWNRLNDAAKTRFYLDNIVQHCGSEYQTEARTYLDQTPMSTIDHNCVGCHVNKK